METLTTAKSARLLLTGNHHQLAPLVRAARRLQRLTHRLREALAPELRDHCHIARFEKGELIISVDSAVWATRLRFLAPELIKTLHRCPEFSDLKHLQGHITITPATAQTTTHRRRPRLSTTHRTLLQNTAQTIHHPALASALRRLSAG